MKIETFITIINEQAKKDINLDLLELVKLKDKELLEEYFYNHYRVIDGAITTQIQFSDSKLNTFLQKIKGKFTEFEDDIFSLFYEYLIGLIEKKSDKFNDIVNDIDSLRNYIKIGFDNFLKDKKDEANHIKIRKVNGKRYKIADDVVEVKLNDNIINHVKSQVPASSEYTEIGQYELDRQAFIYFKKREPESEEELDKYIKELDAKERLGLDFSKNSYKYTYKHLLTANQIEKIDILLNAVTNNPGILNDLLDKNDPTKINKLAMAKILFPESVDKGNSGEPERRINSLLTSINKKINKNKVTKLPVDFRETYRTTLPKKENKNYHQYLKHLISEEDRIKLFAGEVSTSE